MSAERRDGAPRRVICILGSPRTGTHLVNSVICGSELVVPMLSETAPVNYIVGAYRQTLSHQERFGGMHFEQPQEVRALYGELLGAFIDHLSSRYDREVCVFRSPMLSRSASLLRELLAAARARAQIVCMVRDPRDVVASMRRWARERERRGGGALVEGQDELRSMTNWFLVSYHDLLGRDFDRRDPDVLIVRYEDLVHSPQVAAGRIGAFTGLELGDPSSGAGWNEARIAFTPSDERIGEAVTELYGRPPSDSSVGGWRQELTAQEAARVLRFTKPMLERLYPDLVSARSISA